MNPAFENHQQGDAADRDPEEHTLDEGAGADIFQGLAGDRRADQKQSNAKPDAAEPGELDIFGMEPLDDGVGDGGEAEEKDEPGEMDFGAAAPNDGGADGHGDDPEGAGELDGCGDGEGDSSIARGGADDRAGVVDGESGPEAELGLGEMQGVADDGKDEERDRVEDEDGAHGDGHGFFAGIGDRGESGDGAATADGGSGGDEEARGFGNAEQEGEADAEEHGEGNAEGGVDEAGAADADDLAEVHAEAEADH